jgi:hypothetical protein
MSVGMHCGVDGLFVADPFLTNSFFDHRDTPHASWSESA